MNNSTTNVATATATVPQPCRVLGTSLRPFCLGHRLLFKRLKLPFVGDANAAAGADEILVAIFICAANYEDTLNALLDGTWSETFKRWKRAVQGPWYWPNKSDMARTERLFRKYLRQGNAEPPVWREASSLGISLSAPWEELLKCRLVMAGFSETEVLNGYLPMRWYDYFTVTEIQRAEKLQDRKDWKPVFITPKIGAALPRTNKGGT